MSTGDIWIFGGAIAALIGVACVIRTSINRHEDIVPPLMFDDESIREFSTRNWMRVPEAKRMACIVYLRKTIPSHVLDSWKKGFPEGFHFGPGMQVRNALRDIMKDDELPPVQYPFGMSQNWDDHYMGCLHELLDKMDVKS